MENSILYEDAHLTCVEQFGTQRDAVIVSFGEMLMRPSPEKPIWAGAPLRKLGFAGIGFVAKAENWFPKDSIHNAAAAVRSRIANYPARIGYGFSMGGWAVLNYAQLFNLDISIAFSPQYSINPEEINDRRFSRHFDPLLHKDMAIIKQKCPGFNVVVCDPHDPGDWESAQKIAHAIDTTLIPLPHVGHGSVRCITRTNTLGAIFTAAMAQDRNAIECVLKETRRNAPARASTIAHRIAHKKPRTAFAIYLKYPESFPMAHRAGFFYKLRKTPYQKQCFDEMKRLYKTQKETNGYLPVLALFMMDMGNIEDAKSYIAKALERHDTPNNRYISQQINR
jgi:hypothetical protein